MYWSGVAALSVTWLLAAVDEPTWSALSYFVQWVVTSTIFLKSLMKFLVVGFPITFLWLKDFSTMLNRALSSTCGSVLRMSHMPGYFILNLYLPLTSWGTAYVGYSSLAVPSLNAGYSIAGDLDSNSSIETSCTGVAAVTRCGKEDCSSSVIFLFSD